MINNINNLFYLVINQTRDKICYFSLILSHVISYFPKFKKLIHMTNWYLVNFHLDPKMYDKI